MRPTPVIALSDRERSELESVRDSSPKPYLRERAAAVLKVDSGWTMRRVAAEGLLRPREEQSVAAWVRAYLRSRRAEMPVRPGRGRKPAFSPLAPRPGRGEVAGA